MASPRHNPHLFTWRRFTKCKTPTKKVQLNNGDIDQWMKRVEMASEFAVSEVFSLKKPHSGLSRQAMALQSTDQLQDHDDAYTEAQALLSHWMNSKLRQELEMDEEDQLIGSSEKSCHVALGTVQPTTLDYSKFDDLYNHLAEEEESYAVNNFLQDLMEREVVDSGIVEDLALDSEQKEKHMRDPTITMEARHRQVRENRARQDAERGRQQREREARREAREEARRREREEETRRKQEARRQEEMVQQEMVKLRRQMEERRGVEQLVRQRERERLDRQRAVRSLKPDLSLSMAQQHQDTERLHREQQIQSRVHMLNLKCLQRHFSGWYSVLLERRVRTGKAAALCDWRRQLRAWRAWQALVWAGRKQKEAEKTEEELRAENRRCQLAMESNRRRLLRRCLNEWQLWCRRVREQRELLAQQEETRRKMAALINAAAAGKLKATEPTANEHSTTQAETSGQPEAAEKQGHHRSDTPASAPCPTSQGDSSAGAVAKPTQPWQVNRQHTALSASELLRAQQTGERDAGHNAAHSRSATSRGGRFENRHTTQQRTIAEQKRLLREQQEQIARLQEEQSMMGLKLEAQRAAQQLTKPAIPAASRTKGPNLDPKEQRAPSVPRENGGRCSAPRKAVTQQPCPHPIVMAMEERAHQRAERRREVEEFKRKKEEEKLAQMKATEEERQRAEEEERLRAVERRKEEKRQEREREQEKQRQLEREQQHQTLARQHYHRTLLLRRGLAPWQRLLHLSQTNQQLAKDHHSLSVLRWCVLAWQHAAGESLARRQASADQLLHHFLLRRSLNCWKRLKDWRMIQGERAERLYRQRTLRRVLRALLDYVTEERLMEWDRQELAQQHSDRRALRSCLLAWRQFPCLLRQEREREVRREQLRRRVAEVLPDFRSSPLECPWEQPSL